MAFRTDQVLSSPLLGTEVPLALSSSKLKTHIEFRNSLKPLPLTPSNLDYTFFAKSHTGASCTLSNLSAAASVIWESVAQTWSCSSALEKKIKRNIPQILNNKNFRMNLEKHLAIQDVIQSVSFSTLRITTRQIGDLHLVFNQALVLGYTATEQCAMTYHFLSYADTLRSRVHLIVTALEDIIGKYTRSQEEVVTYYLAVVDTAAQILSASDYFDSVKSIYSYSQGRVLWWHNKDITDHFYKVTEQSIATRQGIYYVDYLARDDPMTCLLVFSVQKCFFFPEIDLCEGVKVQFKRMRKQNSEPLLQAEAGREVLWMFRKEYI